MSVAALAAHSAAPHAQPQPAAAGVRSREGGTTIRVPLRLVVGAQYPDVALSVYVKVAALALRPEGCTAKVSVIAEYVGMSKSAVERGLKTLRAPDLVDGITEVPTIRRTLPGGRGQSAHRVTRALADDELFVLVPVRAAEALTPRMLRLYALLAYATARGIPVTIGELAEMLHHHSGAKAGLPLTEWQARRLVQDLAATGWLTVHAREGEQGRHAYETHRHPLHTVGPTPADEAEDAPQAVALEAEPSEQDTHPAEAEALEDQALGQLPLWDDGSPDFYDGSGSSDHEGSLASEEDPVTDRLVNCAPPVGVSRRRRGDRKWGAVPVENPGADVPETFRPGTSRAPRGNHPASAPAATAYDGPELRWTRRIHTALAPVRHLISSETSRFTLRRVAREIARQLDDAAENLMSPERMAARIAARYRDARQIEDLGAWLLAVAVVPKGCGQPLCEDGRTWPTGARCETCAHQRQITREEWRQARVLEERLAELRARRDVPAKADYRHRSEASDAEVLAVAAQYGPAAALHRYGLLRAGELLRTRYPEPVASVAVPAAAPPPVIEETPMPDGYMPDSFRAAIDRAAPTGALSIPCPEPGCLAATGQACTSGRGRTRAPHASRTTAAETRGEET